MYVITKLGLLFVYDLETATAVYRTRISADPIFLAAPAPELGGFTAINRHACGDEGLLMGLIVLGIGAAGLDCHASPTSLRCTVSSPCSAGAARCCWAQ